MNNAIEQGTRKIFPLEGLHQIGTVEPGYIISAEAAKDVINGKGTKDDFNKTDLTLLDPEFLVLFAQVMEAGAKKYKRNNWKMSLEPIRILAASLRHIFALWKGEWIDKESGLPHTCHVACNMQFLDFYRRKGEKIEA